MEKYFVTIEKCVICRKDTGNLLMDKRLRNQFEMHTTFPTSVCDICRKQYLQNGTMLINPNTGTLVVIKDEAFKRIFDKPLPLRKIAFCDEPLLIKLREGVS